MFCTKLGFRFISRLFKYGMNFRIFLRVKKIVQRLAKSANIVNEKIFKLKKLHVKKMLCRSNT